MNPENLLGEWSRLLFESLADAGLEDVVVSPGSRSTPLVWAALGAKRLRCTSIIDERAAAFYAVGHARVSGRPAALVCTSGSAVANYFPAVVEAALSRTPLLVISADRPFELQDCGASQTIDQTRIYGTYAKFVELGMPDATDSALVALRRRAPQALLDARFPEPGVVHCNFRARKPLEPLPGKSPEGLALTSKVDALLRTPITAAPRPRLVASEDALRALASELSNALRGLIVCGPAPLHSRARRGAVASLSVATGFPVYAEATSQLRFDTPGELPPELCFENLDLLARSDLFSRVGVPDVVVQVGGPPVSAAWERLVAAHPEMARHVLAEQGFPDPDGRARSVILGDVATSVAHLATVAAQHGPTAQQKRWAALLDAASAVVGRVLADGDKEAPFPSEGVATRIVCAALPRGAVLALGNSLPVRHADAFGSARRETGISVSSQRGTAGIDGVVAGAAGAADASRRATVLLVGDVSALHDVGGFAVAAAARAPLVIVVLNNDGGRIFEQLPVLAAGLDESQLHFWTTPHGHTFEPVARLYGLSYERPNTATTLRSALENGLRKPGCTLVEVVCPAHGAEQEYSALKRKLEDAFASWAWTEKAST